MGMMAQDGSQPMPMQGVPPPVPPPSQLPPEANPPVAQQQVLNPQTKPSRCAPADLFLSAGFFLSTPLPFHPPPRSLACPPILRSTERPSGEGRGLARAHACAHTCTPCTHADTHTRARKEDRQGRRHNRTSNHLRNRQCLRLCPPLHLRSVPVPSLSLALPASLLPLLTSLLQQCS